jgi:carbamoyl-phosphate synthase large subunit
MNSAILVSSGGAKIPLIRQVKDAAARTSRSPRVISADSNPQAICQYFSDDFWVMKPLQEYSNEELVAELIKRDIHFVIPTRDGELKRWAQMRSLLLAVGIKVLVSKETTIEKSVDKLRFSQWLSKNKFKHVETLTNPSLGKNMKLVIKERYADSPKNTVIGVNENEALELARNHKEPIFQEYVEGQEISVDIWIHASGKTSCLARTRDVIVDGEAHVTKLYPNRHLEEMALQMAVKLGIEGPSVIQFIQNPEGIFIPIECNARIGGATTFSISTKFDSIYIALCEFFQEPSINANPASHFNMQVRAMKDFYFK